MKFLLFVLLTFLAGNVMAIITNTEIIDGPNIQADGSRSGTIKFTFDTGEPVNRTVMAPTALAWADLLLTLPAEVLLARQLIDAENAALTNLEVAAVDQADIKQVALAYLRAAYEIPDPYQAYLKFDKFNNYRINQGWSIDQVVVNLLTVGLTQEEWDLMKARYLYLANAARVTAMQTYQLVYDGDIWGVEFR